MHGGLGFCHTGGLLCPSRGGPGHRATQLDHSGREAAATGTAPGARDRVRRRRTERTAGRPRWLGQGSQREENVESRRSSWGPGQDTCRAEGKRQAGRAASGHSLGSCLASSLPTPPSLPLATTGAQALPAPGSQVESAGHSSTWPLGPAGSLLSSSGSAMQVGLWGRPRESPTHPSVGYERGRRAPGRGGVHTGPE